MLDSRLVVLRLGPLEPLLVLVQLNIALCQSQPSAEPAAPPKHPHTQYPPPLAVLLSSISPVCTLLDSLGDGRELAKDELKHRLTLNLVPMWLDFAVWIPTNCKWHKGLKRSNCCFDILYATMMEVDMVLKIGVHYVLGMLFTQCAHSAKLGRLGTTQTCVFTTLGYRYALC